MFKTRKSDGRVFNDNRQRSDKHHGSVKPESGVKSEEYKIIDKNVFCPQGHRMEMSYVHYDAIKDHCPKCKKYFVYDKRDPENTMREVTKEYYGGSNELNYNHKDIAYTPYGLMMKDARHEINEMAKWKEWKKKVDEAELDDWVAGGGRSGEARYAEIINLEDIPMLNSRKNNDRELKQAKDAFRYVLQEQVKKNLGSNYDIVWDVTGNKIELITDSREF